MDYANQLHSLISEWEATTKEMSYTMRLLSAITAGGGDPFLYFRDRGFNCFSLYSANPNNIGAIVAIIAKSFDFPCVRFLSSQKIIAEHLGQFAVFESIDEIHDINREVPIMLCDNDSTHKHNTFNKLQSLTDHLFSINDLLLYALEMGLIFKPLINRINTKLLCVQAVSAWEIHNRTDHENKMMEIEQYNISGMWEEAYKAAQSHMVANSHLDYANEDYVHDLYSHYAPLIRTGNKEYRADVTSKYVNSVNGFRETFHKPTKPDRTVWVLGTSVCYGIGVEDQYTIQSSLQKILNDEIPNHNFEVVNYANIQNVHVSRYVRNAIEALPIQRNDIVVIIWQSLSCLVSQMICETKQDKVLHLVMSNYFQHPHDMGDVFMDSVCHMNRIGYQRYAEIIFDTLQREGIINQSVNTPNTQILETASETSELSNYLKTLSALRVQIGAIVMNCNPFTNGHRYLIEESAKKVEKLYIFVVEEDKSDFPFTDRIKLVKDGTIDLANVEVIPSGKFIISSTTFEAYFTKADLQSITIDPSYDVELFGSSIAPALGITVRFAGEEPFDNITRQYNEAMRKILPAHGVRFEEIPRKEACGKVISASLVRKCLADKDFITIATLVPKTTLAYLLEKYKTQ